MSIDDYILFIGMDPAIIGDYFGICVHALPAVIPTGKPWIPLLIKLATLQNVNYDTTWTKLNKGKQKKTKEAYEEMIKEQAAWNIAGGRGVSPLSKHLGIKDEEEFLARFHKTQSTS